MGPVQAVEGIRAELAREMIGLMEERSAARASRRATQTRVVQVTGRQMTAATPGDFEDVKSMGLERDGRIACLRTDRDVAAHGSRPSRRCR